RIRSGRMPPVLASGGGVVEGKSETQECGDAMTPITMTITGTVVSLKNSRRLVRNRRTGKPFSIKSADAERFVRDFVAQVPAKYRGLKLGSEEHPLRVSIVVYYPSLRSDLSLEIVYDALQLAGVI